MTHFFAGAKTLADRVREILLVRRLIEFSGSRGLRRLRCRLGLGRILRLVCRLGPGLCRIFVLPAGGPTLAPACAALCRHGRGPAEPLRPPPRRVHPPPSSPRPSPTSA